MNPQLFPATPRDDIRGWERTLLAFLAEKERRPGSRRTVESYSRMLCPSSGGWDSTATVPMPSARRRTASSSATAS
jgi:hypothetical protein